MFKSLEEILKDAKNRLGFKYYADGGIEKTPIKEVLSWQSGVNLKGSKYIYKKMDSNSADIVRKKGNSEELIGYVFKNK